MIAGRLKERLTLLRPVAGDNGLGEETPAGFEEYRTVHAERVRYSGRRSEEAGEHFPDYRAEFNVRDAHPVAEDWRAVWADGNEYAVTAVLRNPDKGMKTLVCERINK